MTAFCDVIVRQKSMKLAVLLYEVTKELPSYERQGLFSRIRRCAISVPSDHSEGYGRNTTIESMRFTSLSRGTLYDLQTQLEISLNLGCRVLTEFDNLEML
tara:strand:+ start:665 stop:967 length:303 start_codon:yes stop_codon:yes gene_type:complete